MLVDGCVRVDVKVSTLGATGNFQWRRLHQKECDLFMLVCLSEVDDEPRAWERLYFVPAYALDGQSKLSLSPPLAAPRGVEGQLGCRSPAWLGALLPV